MKYSILIQGSGEAQTGKTNAADIATSKLVSDLKGGGHQITHASIILDDTKRLPLVGGAVPHEIPEGVASATAEELPAELKKLDKKELPAELKKLDKKELQSALTAALAKIHALEAAAAAGPAESVNTPETTEPVTTHTEDTEE
jgi:hypothetical protein